MKRRKAKHGRPRQHGFTIESTAVHEAAHAVVHVRLGTPLLSVDIKPRKIATQKGMLMSAGYTQMEPGYSERWRRQLPDPEAHFRLENVAVGIAAGIVADTLVNGLKIGDTSHRGDLESIVHIAYWLGVEHPESSDVFREWLADRYAAAAEVLTRNESAAWKHVTEHLVNLKTLSGTDVARLISEADLPATASG
jgi:hypothetical protein